MAGVLTCSLYKAFPYVDAETRHVVGNHSHGSCLFPYKTRPLIFYYLGSQHGATISTIPHIPMTESTTLNLTLPMSPPFPSHSPVASACSPFLALNLKPSALTQGFRVRVNPRICYLLPPTEQQFVQLILHKKIQHFGNPAGFQPSDLDSLD